MIKTFNLGLDLFKVWFNISLKSSNCKKLLFNFCKTRSIENRRSEIFCRISKCSPSPYDLVKCFTPNIKGKTLVTLEKSLLSCVLSFL